MKTLVYTDSKTRKTWVNLPDNAPDSHASKGIPIGPPSLSSLNLPVDIEVRLHNELFNRGILTAKDARRRQVEIFAALQSALRVDTTRIQNLYLGVL